MGNCTLNCRNSQFLPPPSHSISNRRSLVYYYFPFTEKQKIFCEIWRSNLGTFLQGKITKEEEEEGPPFKRGEGRDRKMKTPNQILLKVKEGGEERGIKRLILTTIFFLSPFFAVIKNISFDFPTFFFGGGGMRQSRNPPPQNQPMPPSQTKTNAGYIQKKAFFQHLRKKQLELRNFSHKDWQCEVWIAYLSFFRLNEFPKMWHNVFTASLSIYAANTFSV